MVPAGPGVEDGPPARRQRATLDTGHLSRPRSNGRHDALPGPVVMMSESDYGRCDGLGPWFLITGPARDSGHGPTESATRPVAPGRASLRRIRTPAPAPAWALRLAWPSGLTPGGRRPGAPRPAGRASRSRDPGRGSRHSTGATVPGPDHDSEGRGWSLAANTELASEHIQVSQSKHESCHWQVARRSGYSLSRLRLSLRVSVSAGRIPSRPGARRRVWIGRGYNLANLTPSRDFKWTRNFKPELKARPDSSDSAVALNKWPP
jgi:hypothetical protein